MAPHKRIRTLYVNCKTLKTLLEEEKYKIVKKILSDEILYLFYEDYKNYLNCFEKIKFFNFEGGLGFWPLIDIILKECLQIKRVYVIGFDQYDDSVDLKNYLNLLEERYLKKNFKFIVISSMNEKYTRQRKLNLIFEQSNSKYVHELDNLLDNFDTNFNENELDAFNKLGKTFKAYNEIQLYSNKIGELKEYIKEKKKKYLFKFISFYNKLQKKYNSNLNEEEIMDISEEKYEKILSFKINYKYSEDEIKERIINIPFRFFNVSFLKDYYIIQVAFPLINEI